MVEKLRREGNNGFLFANGGFATDNHCIVLSKVPVAAASFPQDFDYQAEADAARGTIPALDEDYCGQASVESFTVFHDRAGTPNAGVVIARSADGIRTLAHIDVSDPELMAFFTDGTTEPVGHSGRVELRNESSRFWAR
jgi:acetyl-CoA C-acetyltransferase